MQHLSIKKWKSKVKVKVKFAVEQVTKTQKGIRDIVLHFL